MNTVENRSDYEHSIHRTKEILFKLFPDSKIKFDATWLGKNIPERVKGISFIHGEYTITYVGHKATISNGRVLSHYKIKGNTEKNQNKLSLVIEEVYKNSKVLTFQWEEKQTKDFKWFEFNSLGELAIAEELTKRNILFFCNAKCLISNKFNEAEKMIPDFLVIYQGKARILEVDGEQYHGDRFNDYRRDRLFERHGLRTTRYTYDECVADSKRIIDEFLELFEDGINYFHQLIRTFQTNSKT